MVVCFVMSVATQVVKSACMTRSSFLVCHYKFDEGTTAWISMWSVESNGYYERPWLYTFRCNMVSRLLTSISMSKLVVQ